MVDFFKTNHNGGLQITICRVRFRFLIKQVRLVLVFAKTSCFRGFLKVHRWTKVFLNQECHQQYNWHLNMVVKITTNSRIEMRTDQYHVDHHFDH